ncbi:MAG: bis(5'-nucleosyl)-tetraphosphatase (symmetrical) YqeK [Deltaproteobacteria bacterium]
MTYEQMTKKLMGMLSQKKYEHCIAVKDSAVKLAFIHGADAEKASIAGLLHDCAKCMTEQELLKKAEEFGILLDDVSKREAGILHAAIGAEIAEREFEVTDTDILNAIKSHTTGKENMNLLDKIIYIADYISEDRNFKGIKDLRKVAQEDLNAGVLMGMDFTIGHVISKGRLIHIETIKARNALIIENPGISYESII